MANVRISLVGLLMVLLLIGAFLSTVWGTKVKNLDGSTGARLGNNKFSDATSLDSADGERGNIRFGTSGGSDLQSFDSKRIGSVFLAVDHRQLLRDAYSQSNSVAAVPVNNQGKYTGKFFFYAQIGAPVGYYCDMIASAIYNKVPLILGHWGRGRVSFRQVDIRLQWVLEFLHQIEDPEALVLSVDAADSFFQVDAHSIASAAQQLLFSLNATAIFSTENDCFVLSLKGRGCGHPAFTRSKSGKVKYISTGLWVGKVRFMRKLFAKAIDLLQSFKVSRDDQSVIGYIFAETAAGKLSDMLSEGRVVLDNDNALFQSFAQAEKPEMSGFVGGVLYNKLLGTYSGVVHFNGRGKRWYPTWRKFFWWSHLPPPMDGVVTINGKGTRFGTVCPVAVPTVVESPPLLRGSGAAPTTVPKSPTEEILSSSGSDASLFLFDSQASVGNFLGEQSSDGLEPGRNQEPNRDSPARAGAASPWPRNMPFKQGKLNISFPPHVFIDDTAMYNSWTSVVGTLPFILVLSLALLVGLWRFSRSQMAHNIGGPPLIVARPVNRAGRPE
jgi:hypothetical protein